MTLKNYIQIGKKNYAYTLEPMDTKVTRIVCKDAKIDQEFLNEDLVSLLSDLPYLIQSEQKYQEKQDSVIRFRVSARERAKIQAKVKSE